MIFKISFGFDTDTEQILDLKVIREGDVEEHINTTEIPLENTTLSLHPTVLKDLAVKNNDRLAVLFEHSAGRTTAKLVNPKLHPVVGDGSRVTNKFTIVIKGGNLKKLKALGDVFHSLKLERGMVELIPALTVNEDELQNIDNLEVYNEDTIDNY